ncbi:HAD family hydrolase [Sporosarcina limicola]|uniref:Phosphoserine phosphatase n=1 Tax=Sporosarcina limicola TaxID=34101 RepID=A0A927MJ93_9BACL|nr:HAD family hydrolase [Sporosarcina limicola]MBE1554167.1 putative hydrolase of the HAD superfamily [Sporosarcina limicola]
MIKAIIFDLDDTLLWDNKSVATAFKMTCKHAVNTYDLDPTSLEEAVRLEARELYASYETYAYTQMIGINPFEGLWGTFDDEGESFQKMKEIVPSYRQEAWTRGLNRIGIEDAKLGGELAELFPQERKRRPFVYEETFSVLDKLKGNYKLVLLTNGSTSLQHTKLEITPEISPYFDHIIISGAFGKGKPEPTIFEHVLALNDVTADEALMVGDNLMTDILGSSRVGMRSVWINREQKERSGEIIPTYEIDNLEMLFPILQKL